jgi:hypothetical protein
MRKLLRSLRVWLATGAEADVNHEVAARVIRTVAGVFLRGDYFDGHDAMSSIPLDREAVTRAPDTDDGARAGILPCACGFPWG